MANLPRHLRFGRFLTSTTGSIAAFLVVYLLLLRYYRSVSYRDPTSLFFDANRAYERHYSSTRIKEAEAFLRGAGGHDPPPRRTGDVPTMCVGIVTVRRRDHQYVPLTVASLLDGLNESERKSLFLELLVGNSNPFDHPIYSETWVQSLPDRVLTYSEDDGDFKQIQQWEEGGWYRNKTIYDYLYLMRNCYETGAEYIAMIEDDTIAVKGWFPAAMQALAAVQERTIFQGEWLYLRLFYTDGLLGWNSEEWLQYLFWSLVFWVLLTAAIVAARRYFLPLKTLPDSTTWVISGVFIPSVIVLHFLAGRQTMWPLSAGVHEMNKYGCCSQGLVFPGSIVPQFMEQTDLTTDWLVDMMVESIADRQKWSRWAVVPSLLQHIGATSSKGYGFDDSAKTLWNFRFEVYFS